MTGNVLIPSKKIPRRKTFSKTADEHESLTVPTHPLKVKPSGNAYTASENIKAAAGLFVTMPDELIVHLLEFLDAASLLRLGSACKALYAFCRLEDLWKTLCIEYDIFPYVFVFGASLSVSNWNTPFGISHVFAVPGGFIPSSARDRFDQKVGWISVKRVYIINC